jgi:D-3-phosphoglycerate dehydrogenase
MMDKRKILFVDTSHPALPDMLEAEGYICEYFPGYGYDDFLRIIPEYYGVIIRSGIKLDAKILKAAFKLKFIARIGAGMENIDEEVAKEMGILCLNAPEGNRDALAEHAMGMLLSLFNNLIKADAEVRQGLWKREENRGLELMGKTIGLIGYGNMGAAFARRLGGFGVKVLAYDKYKVFYEDAFVEETSLEKIFRETDILSLHVPLSSETKYMVNDDFLRKFQKNIYLINTSRGKVVNTDDLVMAMKSGKVLGAALDVLEYENLSFEDIRKEDLPGAFLYLKESPRCILSPHIAGWTHESNYKLTKVVFEKIMLHFNC